MMGKLRIDLAVLLRNAALQIRAPSRVDGPALAGELDQAARNIERLRRGDMSLHEFCDLYGLPGRVYEPDDTPAPFIHGPEAERL